MEIEPDMKDFERQLDKNLKRKYKTKIQPTSEQVYHTSAVQDRMDRLANRMHTLRDAASQRGLTVKQGNEFAESFIEYKKYADRFGIIIDSTFTDMAKEMETSMKPQFKEIGKQLSDMIKNGAGEVTGNAIKHYNKYYGAGEREAQQKKVAESKAPAAVQGNTSAINNTNQQLDETNSKLRDARNNAQQLSDAIGDAGSTGGDALLDKVEEISRKIEEIKGKTKSTVQTVSSLLSDGVELGEFDDYYEGNLTLIEQLKKEAKELREMVGDLNIDRSDKKNRNKSNAVLNDLNLLDNMISMYEGQVTSAYDDMVAETAKRQNEAEEKIRKRTEDFLQRLTSDYRFKDYGRGNWRKEIIEKLKDEALTDKDIEGIYAEYEEKMEHNKVIQDEQKKKVQQAERQSSLKKFLLSRYTGGESGKEDYLSRYEQYFDKVKDLGANMDDVFAEIQASWDKSAGKDGISLPLDEIDNQISEVEAKTKKMIEDISLLFMDPISSDQTEDYYTNLLQQIEGVENAYKELKQSMSDLEIPETATNLTGRSSNLTNQFAFIDQMIGQQKSRIHSVYDNIDFEAQKAQKELEEKMLQRQADLIQRISSNDDYKKYGDSTLFADYIEKVKTDLRSVDEIYAEFETKLATRKASILAQEEKTNKQQENRGKFLSFLRGVSPSGEQEYGENLTKYADLLNTITDDAKTLEDAINHVNNAIGKSSPESSSVQQLIDRYKELKTLLSEIEQRQHTPSEWNQTNKELRQVQTDLRNSGMYYDASTGEWVEDIINLNEQYQILVDLIKKGDIDSINKMFQLRFDAENIDDVERYRKNFEALIQTLEQANIDTSSFSRSLFEGWFMSDLGNPDSGIGGGLRGIGIDEKLVSRFVNKVTSNAGNKGDLNELSEQEQEILSKASAMAKELQEQFGLSKGTVKELTEAINEMMTALSKGEDIDIRGIGDILAKDKNIIEESDPDNMRSKILKYLKGVKIRNLPDYAQEFGDDWQNVRNSLGFNVIRNGEGSDLINVLSEMNDAIGTTFDLDQSNVNAMIDLVEAIRGGSTSAKDLVKYLVEIGELDFNKLENQMNDIVDDIFPGREKQKKKSDISDDDFLPISDDDELPIDPEDFTRPYEKGAEAAGEFREEAEKANDALRELNSSETPVPTSDATDILEKETDAYEKATDAAKEHAGAVKEVNDTVKVESSEKLNEAANLQTPIQDIDRLINKLQELLEEIQKISQAFGQIDENSGIKSLLDQLNSLSKYLLDIRQSVGVVGEGGSKRAQQDSMSIRERLIAMQGKIGKNSLNINLREDSSLDVQQRIKAEEDEWRRQSQRYVDAYDEIFNIFRSYDDLLNGPEKFLVNLPLSKTFKESTYGLDVAKEFNRSNIVESIKDPIERIQSIMDFMSNVKIALTEITRDALWKQFSENFKQSEYFKGEYSDDDFQNWIDNNSKLVNEAMKDDAYYGVLQYLNGKTRKKAPSTNMAYLNSKIRGIYDITGSHKDKKSLKEETFDFLGNILGGEENNEAANIHEDYQKEIDGIIGKIEELQKVLNDGFGIKELDDGSITTFFDQLIAKIQELIDMFKELENIKPSSATTDTGDAVKDAADKITEEGSAAEEAAKKKKDFAEANENVANTAKDTSSSTGDATAGIKGEGDAAEEAKKQKNEFTKANEKAAESAENTGKKAKEAEDGIQSEGDAAEATGNTIDHIGKKIVRTQENNRGDWEKRYVDEPAHTRIEGGRLIDFDDDGNPIFDEYSRDIIAFNKLESEAIRITNELTDATAALSAAQSKQLGSTVENPINDRIAILKQQLKEINDAVDEYERMSQSGEMTHPYSRALFESRVKPDTEKHAAKVAQKSAEQLLRHQEAIQKELDKRDAYITRQQGRFDRDYNKYIADKDAIKLDPADYKKLQEMQYGKTIDKNGNTVIGDKNNIYGGIQGLLNQYSKSGKNPSSAEREKLEQLIRDYEQTARLAAESQKIATKLQAATPEQAKAALKKDLDSLLRDINSSKADVEDVKSELQKIIAEYDEEQKKYDDVKTRDQSKILDKSFLRGLHSRMKVEESNFKNVQDEYNTNQKQLQEYQNAIKEAYDAKTVLNRMEADKKSGRAVEGEIEAMEELRVKAQAAGDAIFAIFQMAKEGKIDFEDAFASRTMYDISKLGSSQSRSRIKRAENLTKSRETKTELTEYANAMQTYEKLYGKSLLGKELSANETKQMENALQTIVETEKRWNEEKIEGIKLTSKQQKAADQLSDAQKERKNKNKDYTKNMLKESAISKKATDAYNKMEDKLSRMKGQAEWRSDPEAWVKRVEELQDKLGNLEIDVKNEDDLEKLLKLINEIEQDRQALAKDSSMQSIGKDWQAKSLASVNKWMDQNKKAAKEYAEELDNLKKEINDVGSKAGAEEWSAKFARIQADAADKGLLGKSLGDRFKDQFANTMTSLATYYLSFQDFIRYGRQAIQTITELDTQLTEMRKVSDESLQTLQNYQIESFDIASRVGTTASQIQASTADWLRLGENLQEAKKSAEYSTLLLNVSEFSNIEDATDSLVSMSQAFKDVDKLDIIDKLNNIGNNFSISTSDLAQSLQKSAGALITANNSIDEAIALTVAGNQVLQSPDIVGQSLKTISLRLTGTSIEDMQEAGEEIDGLITTQSKLRKTIMDITKVSSNGYTGFDILDDHGNYKSTYEMLKGIAEVWEEIGEEDKKFGSNRQSLLLETVAGKTRAAAASSILQNFSTLQDVYEASLNSQGSAQNELDKYLDSINGKVAQFQNRLQELASVTIDSSWIKAIVDFGSEALKIVTALSKQFGGLNLIAGGVIGTFLQFNGKGLLNFDKSLGKNVFNKDNAFSNIISGFKNAFTKQSFGDDILDSIFSGMDKTDKIYDKVAENANKVKMPDNFVNWFNGLEDADKKAATLGDALEATGQKTLSLSNAFSTLGKIGGTVLSTIGSMVITMVAMFAFEAAIKGIYNLIHAEEIAIEKGKEARQAIQDINKQYDEKQDYVDKNTERYNELRKGVDISETGGVQNKSLSNEEFDEFLSINNQLANLFPSLVSGYDAQGNAMLSLSANADDATSSLNRLLEQERQIADYKVGEQLNDATTGFITRYKQLQKDIKEQDKIIEAGQELQKIVDQEIPEDAKIDLSKFGVDISNREMRFSYDVDSDIESEFATRLQNIYTEAAKDVGGVDWSASDLTSGNIVGALVGITDEQAAKIEENFKAAIQKLDISDIPEEVMDAMSVKNMDISEIKADWNGLVPSILSQLNLYEQYEKLGDSSLGQQLQQIISDDISNINFEGFDESEWKAFGDNPRKFVRENYLDPIIKAIQSEDGTYSEEIMDNIINTISKGDISYKDWVQSVNKLSLDLFNGDYEQALKFRIAIGVTYEDENGNYLFGDADEISKLSDLTGISTNELADLKVEDLELTFDASISGNFDFKGQTIEELQEWIDKYKQTQEDAKKIASEGTLSDLFNDETYKDTADNYEKKLSSLTSALSSIREEGELTAEQMRDLQEEFPSLTDFSEETIGQQASKELGSWIGEIEQKAKGLDFSPKGMEQLNTYLENLVISYGDLEISAEQARNAMRDSFTKDAKGALEHRIGIEEADAAFKALEEKYGEDLNYEIVWMLALEDRFSDPAADIEAEYQDLEIMWTLTINEEEAQHKIEELQGKRSVNEAKKSSIEAGGGQWTDQDYIDDNQISNDIIDQLYIQLQQKASKIENAKSDRARQVAQAAYNSVLQQIYNEQAHIKSNNQARRELALQPFNLALDQVNEEIEKNNRQRTAKQNRGEIDFREENNTDIKLLQESNKMLTLKQIALKTQETLRKAELKMSGKDVDNNKEILDMQKEQQEIEKQKAENNEKILQYKKDNESTQLKIYKAEAQILDYNTQKSKANITNLQDRGLLPSESDYDAYIENLEAEQVKAREIQDQVIHDKDKWYRNYIKGGGKIDLLDENTEWQQYLQDEQDAGNKLNEIINRISEGIKERAALPITRLKNEQQALTRETDRLSSQISDIQSKGNMVYADTYTSAIAAANAELSNLVEQRKELLKTKSELEAKYNEEQLKNNQDYLNALSDLYSNEESMRGLRNQTYSWEQARNQVPLDRIQNVRNDIARQIEGINSEISLGQAFGGKEFGEQYQELVDATQADNEKLEEEETLLKNRKNVIERIGELLNFDITDNGEYLETKDKLATNQKQQVDNIINTIKYITEATQGEIDALSDQRTTNDLQKSLNEAYGKVADEDYYFEDNKISEQFVSKYNKQRRDSIEYIKKLVDDKEIGKELGEYLSDTINAQYDQAILQERAKQAENIQAIRELPIKNIQQQRQYISQEMNALQDEIDTNAQIGMPTTQEQYESMIDLYNSDNQQLEEEASILEERMAILEKYRGEKAKENEFYVQWSADLDENRSRQAENRRKILESEQAIRNLPLTHLQNIGTELQRNTKLSNQVITDKESQGLRIDRSDYLTAIRATAYERGNYGAQLKEVERLQDEFIDSYKKVNKIADEDFSMDMLTDNTAWKDLVSQADELADSINNCDQELRQLGNDMQSLTMKDLEASFSSLERDMTKIQRNIDDTKKDTTAGDYIQAISKNYEQQENIRARIAEKYNERYRNVVDGQVETGFVRDLPKTSEAYQTWATDAANLEEELYNATAANDSFVESLLSLPVTKVTEALDKYQAELRKLQGMYGVNEAKGISMTVEDYQKQIDLQNKINTGNLTSAQVNQGLSWLYGNIFKDKGRQKQFEEAAASDMENYYNGVAEAINQEKAMKEVPMNIAQSELERIQREAEILQSTFDSLEIKGKEITKDSYQGLLDNIDKQIAQQKIVRDEALKLRDAQDMNNEDGSLNLNWATYDQAYTSAITALDGLINQQNELNDAIANIPLTNLQNALSDLENERTSISDTINLNEAKGLKASVKDYQKLTKNTKEQIKNLAKQNVELGKQRIGLDRNGSKYREINDQIRANTASIKQLNGEIIGYESQARRLATIQAQDLSSAIASALSEMGTKTGLSNDTIDSLMTGFSDIAGQDVSNLFYRTAEGVKVDIRELERLVRAENEVKRVQMADEINKQRQAIADYQDQIGKGNTNDKLKEMNSELQDLLRNQSEYYAQYVSQMEQLSRLSQIGLADQTENAGANWDQASQYIKSAKEMYDNGLIGTDDFKSRAAYLDYWGFEDPKTFKENYDKVSAYITDKGMDVQKFLADLVNEGLGHWDGKNFVADFDSMADAAERFKGGIGEEWFTDAWGKIEDYGGFVAYIDSEEALIQKTDDLQQKISESKIKLSDMILSGASADDIEKQEAVVDKYENQLDAINQANEKYVQNTADSYKENFKNVKQAVSSLVDAYKDAELQGDERSMNRYMESIQDILDTYDLKLTAEMEVDEKSYKQAEEEMYTVEDRLQQYSEGGNVDLTRRPQIRTQKLAEAGYEDVGEGYATVFTHTKSNKDETIAMNFTPILPDGSVMEKGEFDKYCEEVVDGVREDTLGLKIGATFSGEDAIEQASKVADEIHQLHEEYFPEREIRTAETALSAQEVGVGMEMASEFGQVLQQVDSAAQDTDSGVSDLIDTLSQFSAEELKSLNLSNGEYEGTFDGAVQAEQALDSLKNTLNLTSEQAQLLAPVLEALGYINPELNVDDSEVDEAKTNVDELDKKVEKPAKKKIEIDEERGSITLPTAHIDRGTYKDTVSESKANADTSAHWSSYDGEHVADVISKEKYAENKESQQPIIDAFAEQGKEIVSVGLDLISAVTDLPSGIVDAMNGNGKNKELESGESTTNKISATSEENRNAYKEELPPDIIARQNRIRMTQENRNAYAEEVQYNVKPEAIVGKQDMIIEGVAHYTAEMDEPPEVPPIEGEAIIKANDDDVQQKKDEIEGSPWTKVVNIATNVAKGFTDLIFGKKQPEEQEVTNHVTNEEETIEKKTTIIEVKNEDALGKIREVKKELADLDDESATPNIDADNGQAINKILSTTTQLNVLNSKVATPKVELDAAATATTNTQLDTIKNKLDQIKSKTITIEIHTSNVGGGLYNQGGHALMYSGTMLSPAHAYGTVNGNLKDVIKEIPITEALAFGSGNVGLPDDEESLVNELGTESIIRNGQWFLIPGGMHVEKLKKGDVILNHMQTADLIKSGKALGHGKAYAQGTAFNGMPAHATKYENGTVIMDVTSDTGPSNNNNNNNNNNGGDGTKAQKENTDATNDNTKATKKSTQAYDWVERRLKYFSDAVEKISSQITDYVTYAFKESQLKKEIKKLKNEVTASTKAMSRYREKAETIVIDTEDAKNDERLKRLVRSGDVASIQTAFEEWDTSDENSKYGKQDEFGKTMSDRLSEYMDYWDKSVEANQNAINYSNDLVDAFQELAQIPLDKAAEKIDKISTSLSNLDAVSSVVSSGTSGMSALINQANTKNSQLGKTREAKIVQDFNKGKYAKMPSKYVRANNALLEEDYKLTKQTVNINKQAVKDEQKNLNTAKKQLDNARKNIYGSGLSSKQEKKYNKKLNLNKIIKSSEMKAFSDEDKENAKTYNALARERRKTNSDIRAARKKLLGIKDSKLTDKQKAAVNKNKTIKLKGLNGDERTAAKEYNATINRRKELDKKLASAKNTLRNGEFSAGQIKAIKSGKQIDVTGLTGSALKQALAYNRAVQKGKIAQDALKQAVDNTVQSETELATKAKEVADAQFQNWKDYYEAYRNYAKSRTSKRQSNLSVKNFATDYMTKEEYDEQVTGNNNDLKYSRREVIGLRKSLANSVKKGRIIQGSAEWKEKMAEINNLEAEINQTRETQLQLFKDWANVPIDKATNAIEKLKNKFEGLRGVLDSFASGGSAVKQFIQTVTSSLADGAKKLASAYKVNKITPKTYTNSANKQSYNIYNDKSYKGRMQALDELIPEQKEIVSQRKTARNTAEANLKKAQSDQKVAEDNAKIQSKSLSNVIKSKKLSKKQKEYISAAINKGEAVDLDNSLMNITDSKVMDAIRDYNKSIDDRTDSMSKAEIATKALDTAEKDLLDAELDLAKMPVENEIEKFNIIKEHWDELREQRRINIEGMEKDLDKSTAHGNYETSADVSVRIKNKEEARKDIESEITELQSQLNKSVKDGIIVEGSEEWIAMNNQILDLKNGLKDIDIETENLTQHQIDIEYDELFNRAVKAADQFIERLNTITGLINDEMLFDEDGFLTAFGATAMVENSTALEESTNNLKTLLDKRKKIIDDYRNDRDYGEEKFNKNMEENQAEIIKTLSDANSLRQTIISQIKNQSKAELDAINKNINAYKEMLSRKKEYYDYDKQLKDKTKNLQSLEKELAALEGVAGMEAAAQRARIKAQLDEANQDMQDTVQDHIYELQVQGLDDLMDRLQENYDDWARSLSQDIQKASETIAEAVANASDSATVMNALGQLFSQFGISLPQLESLEFSTHAKGARRVNKHELALTNEPEYGREIIITKSGILTKLTPGDAVMPNNLTENFFAAAQNYPMIQKTLDSLTSGNRIGNVSAMPTVIQPNISCPITINGSNLSAAEVQGIINSFIPKISQTVQNDIRKDLRKNGR